MTLIDTSSWVDALRRDGDPEVKTRVAALLRELGLRAMDTATGDLFDADTLDEGL